MRLLARLLPALLFPVLTAQTVDFNRDVRPILSDACFACHGPDSGQRQEDLRLDQKEGIFRSVDGVTVVDPKSVENSELLRRILSEDPDTVMPPAGHARKLTAAEKNTIRTWIAEGAAWKGHWSYLPPVRPAVPDVKVSPTGNDIDRFLQQTLDERKLVALEQADAATLARRVALDLTGLPPSPESVRAFAAAPTPENWKLLIDGHLASHHYAERMTGMWLDLVRYADTNGIHGDNHREIWMYRDWVLRAFQSNMPFDQFTVEQLAGDLLPNATDEQKIASGYNKLLMTTREGGAQAKEYLAKYSADRVRNASTVWMGATMGCCECHDHKFDPYSIKDFYSFAAFFADVKDVPVGTQPTVKMPTRAQKEQRTQLDTLLASLQKKLETQTPALDAELNAWATKLNAQLKSTPKVWLPVKLVDMKSVGGQQLSLLPDQSVLTSGPSPKHDTYRVFLQPAAAKLSGIRLETFRHESLVKKSLARGNGNFVLSGVRVTHVRSGDAGETEVALKDPITSYQQKDWPVANALDGKKETGWAVDGHTKFDQDPSAVFRFASPVDFMDGDRLLVELRQEAVEFHNIGRFRLMVSSLPNAPLDDNTLGIPSQFLPVIAKWPAAVEGEKSNLAAHFRSIAPSLNESRALLAKAQKDREALEEAIPATLITQAQQPRTIKVLSRGNWMDDSGEVVSPAVPHFLKQLGADGRKSRLDLAQWFVDSENPLVARVYVNRLWKLLFGRGIVASADDFGSQGSWPTHPELLDWLAVEFRESGWDVQHVIRLIVTSDAYRRSSVTPPALREADPFNYWMARQSRFRLDAEFIRDSALSVSGLLVDKVGGRSVKPYQPTGYWAHLNFPRRTWQADKGENQHRRGLYTYWCRTFLHPAMRSFDAPTREECTVDRPRSNNSLQALVLLNDPSYVEAARELGLRTLREAGATTEARLKYMFELCLSRAPRPQEVQLLSDLLAKQQAYFAGNEAEAGKFLSVGQSPMPDGMNLSEAAAWTAVSRVILNLHETITRS